MKRVSLAVMLTLATGAAFVLVLGGPDLSPESTDLISVTTSREKAGSGTAPAGADSLRLREERGKYLAHVANCVGCHTAQGGQPYAGGRELPTPFGTFITSNITPDERTGI
ncbi:MAG TPA: cytochrome c, partial [Terriglobia bacterium]|nr:cytochrome c [Terriglobia bacterium]